MIRSPCPFPSILLQTSPVPLHNTLFFFANKTRAVWFSCLAAAWFLLFGVFFFFKLLLLLLRLLCDRLFVFFPCYSVLCYW